MYIVIYRFEILKYSIHMDMLIILKVSLEHEYLFLEV